MASKKARKKRAQKKKSPAKSPRKTFTPEARAKILAEAKEQKLTGKQVTEKYGISMLTYYVWRKQSGATRGRGVSRKIGRPASNDPIGAELRTAVQAKIRERLPSLVRHEVDAYLAQVLGSPGRKRRS